MNNLDQAQLQRKSKELDAREEFIDAKAQILKDGPLTLKVYDARVRASEDSLNRLRQEIKLAREDLESLKSEANNFVIANKQRKESFETELRQLKDAIRDAKIYLSELEVSEKSAKKQLTERKNYLQNQESIINEAINEGNATLLDINDEVIQQKAANKQLESEHVALKTALDEAIVAADTKKAQRVRELEELELKRRNLEQVIDNLTKRVEEKSAEFKRITEDTDKKLAQLKGKEESLTTKRDAIILERQELDRDKQRWSSNKALYDV